MKSMQTGDMKKDGIKELEVVFKKLFRNEMKLHLTFRTW